MPDDESATEAAREILRFKKVRELIRTFDEDQLHAMADDEHAEVGARAYARELLLLIQRHDARGDT